MSDIAYRFPDRQDFDSQGDYLATKEIYVDLWISTLELEDMLDCEADEVTRRGRADRLNHLGHLRQIIRSSKKRRVLPQVHRSIDRQAA